MLYRYFDKSKPTQTSSETTPELHNHITHLLLKVKSAVPGLAFKLSAAPPTTIVIAFPGPFFNIFEHDFLDTLQMPMARRMSLYMGRLKLDERVRRWGNIPGKAFEKPVAR